MNPFNSYLKSYQASFDKDVYPELKKLLFGYTKTFPNEVELTLDMVKRGGKRFRSAVYHYCMGQPADSKHYQIEGLIELFHVALLIHDDIVDHADLRRDKPSFHKALGDTDRALIWGDALLAWLPNAFRQVAGDKALALYTQVLDSTCRGQMMDMNLRDAGLPIGDVTESYLFECYGLKTGIYGFYFPMALSLTQQQLEWDREALKTHSMLAGVVYQIADDLLMFHSDHDAKSVEVDYLRKQMTYPIWMIQAERGKSAFAEEGLSFHAWQQKMIQAFRVMDGSKKLKERIHRILSNMNMDLGLSDTSCRQKLSDVFNYLEEVIRIRLENS